MSATLFNRREDHGSGRVSDVFRERRLIREAWAVENGRTAEEPDKVEILNRHHEFWERDRKHAEKKERAAKKKTAKE